MTLLDKIVRFFNEGALGDKRGSNEPVDSLEKLRKRKHSRLSEEADRTGDDARFVASMIMDWIWAAHDGKKDVASPGQFITHFEGRGYKPVSDLSPGEMGSLSPKKRLICQALEDIKVKGALGAALGVKLKALEETGELYAGTRSAPELS